MHALVTGGTGFVGIHLVRELRTRGWRVTCLVRRAVVPVDNDVSAVQVDLLDLDALRLALADTGRIDAVFHLAAMLPQTAKVGNSAYLAANAAATLNMLDIAERLDIDFFVYASSLSILGRPMTLPITEQHIVNPGHAYALSKLCGELACEMVRHQGRRVTSLRISSPYGPGMQDGSVLPRFVKKALLSQEIEWFGSGDRSQDFVNVSDVVQACLLASCSPNPGVYNIAAGVQTSMRALAELVVALVPDSQSAARASGNADPQDDVRWDVDISKARSLLGYIPAVGLEMGIENLIDAIRAKRPPETWWI